MSKVLGIDNGAGGAMCIIDGEKILTHDVPFMEVEGKTVWDYKKICEIVRNSNDEKKFDLAILEKAQAMWKSQIQGVVSTFNYGKNYGAYEMLLVVLDIPYKKIAPMTWQHFFNIKRPKGDAAYDTKVAAAEIVEKMYPTLEIRTKIKTASTGRVTGGKLLDGRSDAALLATYGLEMLKLKDQNLTK